MEESSSECDIPILTKPPLTTNSSSEENDNDGNLFNENYLNM